MKTMLMPVAVSVALVAGPSLAEGPVVTHVTAADLAKALRDAPAGPLAVVTLVTAPEYKVIGVRRGATGEAESHDADIDVSYILEGEAVQVTGGEIVDAKTTAPGEIRGTSIKGGQTRTVRKGDILTVPAKMPHWMKQVNAPMQYIVVKVPAKP
jgi:hypothetical protein